MNNYVCIGKIVNTHGIKGELRILSDFEYKDKIFKNNVSLYVGSLKKEYVINSYRHHKIFEMVTFKGYNNINEVLELKGQLVYINRSILKINEDDYLLNDLIGMEVFDNDELLGVVKDYYLDNGNTLLEIKGKKIFYIPLKSDYIKNVDVKNKKIITNNGGALIL